MCSTMLELMGLARKGRRLTCGPPTDLEQVRGCLSIKPNRNSLPTAANNEQRKLAYLYGFTLQSTI